MTEQRTQRAGVPTKVKITMRKSRNAAGLFEERNTQKEIVDALQLRVDDWVASGYDGASGLSRFLLNYWFGAPHLLAAGKSFFRWHNHQRRAVETAIYTYEVLGLRRTEEYSNLIELERSAQRAPWAKIGLQLATGSGKTKVMSLLMTWAHLHWQLGDESGANNDALNFGNTQLLLFHGFNAPPLAALFSRFPFVLK